MESFYLPNYLAYIRLFKTIAIEYSVVTDRSASKTITFVNIAISNY